MDRRKRLPYNIVSHCGTIQFIQSYISIDKVSVAALDSVSESGSKFVFWRLDASGGLL